MDSHRHRCARDLELARRALASELTKRGARVRIGEVPVEPDVNGPDDLIAKRGDSALFALIDAAKPAARVSSRKDNAEKPKQGHDVQLEDPEPWPEPVNGAVLLDAVARTFTRHLALPAHASTVIALWVMHAYAFNAWFTSPLPRHHVTG